MDRAPLDSEAAGEGWSALAPMRSIWVIVDMGGELESRVVGPLMGEDLFAGLVAPSQKVQQRLRQLSWRRQLDLAMMAAHAKSGAGSAALQLQCPDADAQIVG